MAESDSGEKTEEATQQRRDDYRKRGQVAQTKELSSGLFLFGALLAIWLLSDLFITEITSVFRLSFSDFIIQAVRQGAWIAATKFAVTKTIMVVAPVMGIFTVIAIATNVVQTGFILNEEALQLKLERINPLAGFKRLASTRSLVEGFKAIMKVTLVASVAYLVMRTEVEKIPTMFHLNVPQLMSYIGEIIFKLFMAVALFMSFLAGFDFLFQKWDLEKKMMMSKQEVKEEHKSREGDPMIKARIRRVQREIASRRMMEDVPKADVIVTNPTHIAVAIKYDATMAAPTILAKGAGSVAEKIKALAKEHGVPIVENKPLARTIFKTIKIGQKIPRELYTAVAEVLSYIYKLKKKVRR